jgi:hypothetical protein
MHRTVRPIAHFGVRQLAAALPPASSLARSAQSGGSHGQQAGRNESGSKLPLSRLELVDLHHLIASGIDYLDGDRLVLSGGERQRYCAAQRFEALGIDDAR